jgi:hypothetical protein
MVLADERERASERSEERESDAQERTKFGRKLKMTEFVNISTPSTFVDSSFLFCESAELSLLSKDENNKTNVPECFWEKIPELLVISHKSMPIPV